MIKKILSKIAFIFLPLFSFLLFLYAILFSDNWTIFHELFKSTGGLGFFLLLLIMFIKPVYVINEKYFKIKIFSSISRFILLMRKELWVILFYLVLIHTFSYFFSRYHWQWMETGVIIWFISLFFLWLAAITSNLFSVKFFWKSWKTIQISSYYWLIFWVAHIWFYWEPSLLMLSFLYLGLKIFEYLITPNMWKIYLVNYIILILINSILFWYMIF